MVASATCSPAVTPSPDLPDTHPGEADAANGPTQHVGEHGRVRAGRGEVGEEVGAVPVGHLRKVGGHSGPGRPVRGERAGTRAHHSRLSLQEQPYAPTRRTCREGPAPEVPSLPVTRLFCLLPSECSGWWWGGTGPESSQPWAEAGPRRPLSQTTDETFLPHA